MDVLSVLGPRNTSPSSSTAANQEISEKTVSSAPKDNFDEVSSFSAPRTSYLDKTLGALFRKPANSKETNTRTLEASLNDKKQPVVKTEDGYEITFTGKREEFTIKAPNGRTTTIWGDPHVKESDGDTWDFKEDSTFIFGNNKLTVETTPAKNGTTYSETVSIYNQNHRFTISGIDKNEALIESWSFDAREHDSKLDDGTTYRLGTEANGDDMWEKVE